MRKLDYFYRINVSINDECHQRMLKQAKSYSSEYPVGRIRIPGSFNDITADESLLPFARWILGCLLDQFLDFPSVDIIVYDGEHPDAKRNERRLHNCIDIYIDGCGFLQRPGDLFAVSLEGQLRSIGGARVMISEL